MIINTIEKGVEKIVERKILALFFVAMLGIVLRVYFMPWDYPTNSLDAFVFMNDAINYSKELAKNLVLENWTNLEKVLDESDAKNLLREFAYFVVNRKL